MIVGGCFRAQEKSAPQKMSTCACNMALLHGFLAPLQLQRKRVLFTKPKRVHCFHAALYCTTFYPTPNTQHPTQQLIFALNQVLSFVFRNKILIITILLFLQTVPLLTSYLRYTWNTSAPFFAITNRHLSTAQHQHRHSHPHHLHQHKSISDEAKMKSVLALLLLLTSADAFTTTPSGSVRSTATTTTSSFSRTSIVLEASRNKDKVASRSKWAASRGYGLAAADDSGDAGKSVPRLIIAGAPASGKGTQCEIIKEKCK